MIEPRSAANKMMIVTARLIVIALFVVFVASLVSLFFLRSRFYRATILSMFGGPAAIDTPVGRALGQVLIVLIVSLSVAVLLGKTVLEPAKTRDEAERSGFDSVQEFKEVRRLDLARDVAGLCTRLLTGSVAARLAIVAALEKQNTAFHRRAVTEALLARAQDVDEDRRVRLAAIDTLGSVAGNSVAQAAVALNVSVAHACVALLGDADGIVAEHAAAALENMGARNAVVRKAITDTLGTSSAKDDASGELRGRVMRVLG